MPTLARDVACSAGAVYAREVGKVLLSLRIRVWVGVSADEMKFGIGEREREFVWSVVARYTDVLTVTTTRSIR